MNIGKKIFCRMNHKFINSLMPLLPYRQPEILENMRDVIQVLNKEANPIYPTPVLWDAKELEKLYYLVYEENVNG